MSQLLIPQNILIEAKAREIYIDERARDLCQQWYYKNIAKHDDVGCGFEDYEEIEE